MSNSAAACSAPATLCARAAKPAKAAQMTKPAKAAKPAKAPKKVEPQPNALLLLHAIQTCQLFWLLQLIYNPVSNKQSAMHYTPS